MKTLYQKAKSEIQSLGAIDHELPWLLTLDLIVIAIMAGYGLGVAL